MERLALDTIEILWRVILVAGWFTVASIVCGMVGAACVDAIDARARRKARR